MAARPALVVMAAGLGSRYGGLKQLDSVGPDGAAIIDYSVYDALRAGFGKLVFVINQHSVDEFDTVFAPLKKQVAVEYAFQDKLPPFRNKPWGTGHALLAASDLLSEPFAAINADDFYGQSSYSAAADFLRETAPNSNRYGMLGYALKDTLSEHGSVSRGICSVSEQGELTSVVEHLTINVDDGMVSSRLGDGQTMPLTGLEPTSMNFWLLTPTIFPLLRSGLDAFVEQNSDAPSAEFLIPEFIGELVERQSASVAVLDHSDSWFGLTYPDDKMRAMKLIAEMHAAGAYPTPLWARD